jgi:hypothetical protein
MIRKVKTAVVKNARPYHLAALFTIGFFTAGANHQVTPDLFTRHLIYSGIVFLCAWAGCRLAADGYRRRLALEGAEPATVGDMIATFVLYLELIKHVVGVSFTLGWIAGVMACWDFLGDRILMVPLAASLGVSLLAFLVTFGFSSFVDHLHWPGKDEE